jgi:hypothetical protein
VELLIASVLLGLILLAIAPLFITSIKSNYSGNEYTSLNNLARDKLEQLMSLPVTDVRLNAGSYTNDLPTVLPDPVTGVPPPTAGVLNPLQRTYVVTNFINAPSASVPVPPPAVPWGVTPVAAPNPCSFKRIDVTVQSTSGPTSPLSTLGIGYRAARVSGVVQMPTSAGVCS